MSQSGGAQFTPVCACQAVREYYDTGIGGMFEDKVRLCPFHAAAPVMYADLCAVRDYLFELYDEGNAKAGEYAASLGITIEQAEGQHHE